jgi:hypothetical protein
MDPVEAASASGDAVNGLSAHFMLDLDTYAYGGTLGYQGTDFYLAGRGSALGDVPADVVTAAFVFWCPTTVAEAWERTASLLPRAEVAREFAGVAHRWADAKLPDDDDAARLAELAGAIADAASPACAPLFAGWRALDEPPADQPKALAVHRMNALRELRGALHGAAIICEGISPHAAVARRTPYMLGAFGWQEPHPDKSLVREPWALAQAATDRAMATAYEVLTPAERDEFVALANATQAAVTPA